MMNETTKHECTAACMVDHLVLAMRWVRWNGGRGTEKQALRVMQQIRHETLREMCQARGIEIK